MRSMTEGAPSDLTAFGHLPRKRGRKVAALASPAERR